MAEMEFKVGDRVRTTDFPTSVDTTRGHRVGDVGTIVGRSGFRGEQWIVRFDFRQGVVLYDTDDNVHDDCWACGPEILEYAAPTPDEVQKALDDLETLLDGKKDKVLDDGTFVSPSGAKAIIHVHQQKVKKGEPAVIVRRRGKSRHFTRVEINGPSVMVHSPIADSCGARVWIETKAEVVGYA
jgi:hypothetical protein